MENINFGFLTISTTSDEFYFFYESDLQVTDR
jgi:hypothetical protein